MPIWCTAQISKEKEKEREHLLDVAREVIEAAGNCALISLDSLGKARTRTMDPFLPDKDFVIWFGTNPASRKVAQIRHNPDVTLYYFDKPTSSYVVISGKAIIIDTPSEKALHWKKKWQAFYPHYPQGYSLIKVIPQWLEISSESSGIRSNPVTWQPPRVVFER